MRFIDTFSYHRENSNISLDEYVRSKKIELGKSLDERKKVYLDTKYWIHFRDVILGRAENEVLGILGTLPMGILGTLPITSLPISR